jgi:formyltetrahydrofolate deformylase
MDSHLLLIDCPDEKGLIHKITGILFQHNLNVEDQGEFVDQATGHFFMRTEISGSFNREVVVQELGQIVPSKATVRLEEKREKNLVLLATKEPHCLGDLLIRHAYNELNAQILAVVSNHEHLQELVEKFDLPYHHIPAQNLSREQHEQNILAVLDDYKPDYLILAKYMRIITQTLLNYYQNRIVNIHHSFLPAFVGAKPYHQAFERGVKIIGATAHFVTEDLDSGPIIAQDVIPVSHTKEASDMVRAGRNVEKIVLSEALRLVCENRVFVHGNRTIIFD